MFVDPDLFKLGLKIYGLELAVIENDLIKVFFVD